MKKWFKQTRITKTMLDKRIQEYANGTVKQKAWLLGKVMTYLFKGVTLDDLEEQFNALPDVKKDRLKKEAYTVSNMDLFDWLHKEMMRLAHKQLLIDSDVTKSEELIFAKAMIYLEDVRQTKLNKLAAMGKKLLVKN